MINCFTTVRPLFLEFSLKVLGIQREEAVTTKAYSIHCQDQPGEADLLFKSRVLAYAATTWKKHATTIKGFLEFCRARQLSIFDCTPSVLNLYMLKLSRDGKSFGVVDSFLSGIAFVYRFFLMKNYAEEKPVRDVRKFVEKICEHRANKKDPFGAAEVRIMFDHLISKYASLENVPLPEFRTFCLSVFQHKSFCRFSDVEKIKLSDVFFDADYFKIKIQYSKTDQAGRGSWAFVPKTPGGFLDPHMLLCIYFHRMPFDKHKEEVYLFPPLK